MWKLAISAVWNVNKRLWFNVVINYNKGNRFINTLKKIIEIKEMVLDTVDK